MTSLRRYCVFLAATYCVVTQPLAIGEAQGGPWTGRWLLESPTTADSLRDEAILRATAEMNLVSRRVARRRLRRRAPLPQVLRFVGEGATLRVHIDDHVLDIPPDASRHSVQGARGDDVIASQHLTGRRLKQVLRGSGGTLTQTFDLGDDHILLTVRIASALLPHDVTYELRFRRG